MLSRPDVTPDRARVLIERGLAAVHRATSFVQPLLAFAGLQPLRPVAVDVGSLVTTMVERIRITAGPLVHVTLHIDRNLGLANGDPVHLETAILNLASNARDAMPEGGNLRITVTAATAPVGADTQSEPGVRICVEDTGAGMDEATMDRAVEPFFSAKGIGKGRGLGLSMVQGVAVQLGGTLTLLSELGVGTKVELYLPGPIPSAIVSPSSSRKNAHRSRHSASTALLVDDDDLVRSSTADMLVELGFKVREACSAEEALGLIERGLSFDLLITDHLMAGAMSGVDLANAVRRQRPQTRVLIISGFAEVGAIAADLPKLAKPFRQPELAASIAALLAPHSPR
jgi:CheY-like chemotaxis protein